MSSESVSDLRAALRAGTLERWRVELAGLCGDDAAARVVSAPPPPHDLARWFGELGAFGEDVAVATWAAYCSLKTGGRFGPCAWGQVLPDCALLIFSPPSGPRAVDHARAIANSYLLTRAEDGDLPDGGSSVDFAAGVATETIGRVRAHGLVLSWSRGGLWSASLDATSVRPLLGQRLTEWALRPLRGPSRAPFDLDVLVAPRAWWEGPPPWEAPSDTPRATDGAPS